MKCERSLPTDSKCGRPVVAFVMGQNVCAGHDPQGSTSCSHSLAPSGRCSFCGAVVPVAASTADRTGRDES